MHKLYTQLLRAFLLFSFIILHFNLFGQQINPLINYQGVARKSDGSPITEKVINIKLSILEERENGTTVYSENQKVTTNKFGLFTLTIGHPQVNHTGSISTVNWAAGSKFLKVEIDPEGGNNFIHMGTSQLQHVPYAIHASSAHPSGNASGDLSGIYPNPTVSKIQGQQISNISPTNGQVLKFNGSAWSPADEKNISSLINGNTPLISSINNGIITLSIPQANANNDGYLNKSDWTKFNNKTTSEYVDEVININLSKIDNEITRAETSEAALTINLTNEVNRATTKENAIAADLLTETNRAETAEATLTSNLTNEVNRATNKENAIAADLLVETNRAETAETTLTSNLTNEVNRATAKENDIAADLLTETNRAETAEATLTSNLTTEVNRATAKENTIAADLLAETNRAETAEATLTSNLTTEVNRATAKENALQNEKSDKFRPVNDAENLTLTNNYSNQIIKTQHGLRPYFPENLNDGFNITIVNYSNYDWTSNALTNIKFHSVKSPNGSNTIILPPGGVVNIYVVTISNIKRYYVTGDLK